MSFRSLACTVGMGLVWACGGSAPAARGGSGGDEITTGSGGDGGGGGDQVGMTTSGSGGSMTGVGGSVSPTSDASTGDGATMGSGGSGNGPCGAAGIFVCDDFEATAANAKPDTSKWSIAGNPTITPVIDDKKAHGGTHSLHFAKTDNQGVFISAAKGFPPTNNSFYARAWIFLAKPMKDMGGHVDFIVGATAPENGVEVRLGASQNFASQLEMLDLNLIGSGEEHSQFSNGDYTGGNGTQKPGVTLEAGRWYCLEGFWNGKDHQFQLWVDDVEVPGLRVTDWGKGVMSWSPMYKVGKVGAQKFSGDPGELWYDDVAFGSSRIGCK